MRALATGALALAVVLLPAAYAADWDYGPRASAFISYSFDAPTSDHSTQGMRYGLQLDHDWRHNHAPTTQPLLRWQFRNTGFDRLSVAGTPVVTRDLILRNDGGVVGFLKENFGPIALTVAGGILLFAVIDGKSDTDDREVDDVEGPGAP